MSEAKEPLALTVKQFTERMNISRATVYKLVAAKKLRTVKLAGRTLIPQAEVARLLAGGQTRLRHCRSA
jgi:excisionase family DNA binding protein